MVRKMRIKVLAPLIGLASIAALSITPGTASAGAIVPCPTDYHHVQMPRPFEIYFLRYTILSSTPVFRVSDGRVLDNGLPFPVEYTITSSVSQTVAVTVSVGSQVTLTEQLQLNVSTQIVASRTTQIGVTIQTTVPANSRMIAEYGVESYYVTFGTSMWRWRGGNTCEEWGWYPQATYAPTQLEGWRLRLG